jgi:hypothetical protein
VQGLDLAVQQVLHAGGKMVVLEADRLSELPPEVARVLIGYGATLMIPEPAGNG